MTVSGVTVVLLVTQCEISALILITYWIVFVLHVLFTVLLVTHNFFILILPGFFMFLACFMCVTCNISGYFFVVYFPMNPIFCVTGNT